MDTQTDIAANLALVREKIKEACRRAGRAYSDSLLVAVSKTHGVDAIKAACEAGQRVFGENRVQEAQEKFPPLRDLYPDMTLHLIGPLQTNKAAQAVALFDVIQTLDRPHLVEVLAKEIQKQGRTPRLYVEVNLGREPQKAGVLPEELPAFLELCQSHGLKIDGLMCIPPQEEDPAAFFKQLHALAQKHALNHISMGMSADYEMALACGATEVRVGTAIFGARGCWLSS